MRILQSMSIRIMTFVIVDEKQEEKTMNNSNEPMNGNIPENSYRVLFEGESTTHTYPASTSADEFFSTVAKIICFSDCSGEEVKDIRFHGKQYRYCGWQPGMKFEFRPVTGGENWVGWFPNWDH